MRQVEIPDYRECEGGGIAVLSDRARGRSQGGNPPDRGTRICFRTTKEAQIFIDSAEREGFVVERLKC